MFVNTSLLGFSDLGLFLAVIGVYVFFTALWLIYTLTDRKSQVGSEAEQRIEQLRSEMQHELAQASKSRNSFVSKVAAASKNFVGREEVAQLRSELATVREIAVLSGKRLRVLQAENQKLHSMLTEQSEAMAGHVEAYHGEPEVAAETAPVLSLFQPASVDEQTEATGTTFDAERGLVYDETPSQADDLTRIWGVGAVNQELLNENGVYMFKQIANWTEENIDKFNDILCFRGRIEREDWVGQANRLETAVQQERRAA